MREVMGNVYIHYLSHGLSGIKSPATGQKNRQFWNSNLEPGVGERKGRQTVI
jgi:hypothetical protein